MKATNAGAPRILPYGPITPLKSRLGDSFTNTALACGKGLNSVQTIFKRDNESGDTGILLNVRRDLLVFIAPNHLKAGIIIIYLDKRLFLLT